MIVLNFDNNTIRYYTTKGLKINLNLDIVDDVGKLISTIPHKYLEIVFDNTFVIYKRISENIYVEFK